MKQAFTLVAALAILTGATATPRASATRPHHRSTLQTAKPCTTTWEVTGQKGAVSRPAGNDGPVAKTTSRIRHCLRRGDRVTSCAVAVARPESGPVFRTCGKAGSLWRIVPGGQVPQTFLKRVRWSGRAVGIEGCRVSVPFPAGPAVRGVGGIRA